MIRWSYFLVFVFFTVSCGGDKMYLPKPRMYPKVNYPEKVYQPFTEAYCDFTFNYPQYGKILKDSVFFDGKPAHECWFDIMLPSLNGKIYCNYIPINSRAEFDQLIQDAYRIAGKHNSKASFYNETTIRYPDRVNGILFEIEGDVATPMQFFLTDSTDHFFRGSLYFNNKVNVDSMLPIYNFIKTDIDTLIETFKWRS